MANDFSKLAGMQYSGRVLHAITTRDGEYGLGYTITGRQPSSQARRLVVGEKTGTISVQPVKDEESLKRMFPSETSTHEGLEKLLADLNSGSSALIYYPAIRPARGVGDIPVGIAGSNGVQTNLIYSAFFRGAFTSLEILEAAFLYPHIMHDSQYDRDIDVTMYEPDSPNNTPRINFCLNLDDVNKFAMSLIGKKSDSDEKNVLTYRPFIERRSVLSLPTYKGGNEKPLVSFFGDLLESKTDSVLAGDICEQLYEAIGPKYGKNYRVAAGVVILRDDDKIDTSVINRADRGE